MRMEILPIFSLYLSALSSVVVPHTRADTHTKRTSIYFQAAPKASTQLIGQGRWREGRETNGWGDRLIDLPGRRLLYAVFMLSFLGRLMVGAQRQPAEGVSIGRGWIQGPEQLESTRGGRWPVLWWKTVISTPGACRVSKWNWLAHKETTITNEVAVLQPQNSAIYMKIRNIIVVTFCLWSRDKLVLAFILMQSVEI